MATVPMTMAQAGAGRNYRWFQLFVGIVGMVAIANLQYGWTLFVNPLATKFQPLVPDPKQVKAYIQVAFTFFVLAETWLNPFEGYLVDRFGPRLIWAVGGVLVGLGWVLNSVAQSLGQLYLGGIIGGIGAGIVYGTSIGNALKWFPDRRGLAAGLTAAAFGAGSALTVVPIANMIKSSGYQTAFLWFGLGQGLVVLLAAFFIHAPTAATMPQIPKARVESSGRDYTPLEILKTGPFWLLYLMFTMAVTGGLMATAQLGPIARDYKVADVPVSLMGITLAALPFALSLDRILNGLTRPFFGWVSDQIGRENTMFIAFGLEGIAITMLITYAHIPVLFVVLSGLVFFGWGEVYSLFPATSGDFFGRKYATANYNALYTAKGMAAILVPFGSYLQAATGSWLPIFRLAIAFDFAAALLALFFLKPLRKRWMAAARKAG